MKQRRHFFLIQWTKATKNSQCKFLSASLYIYIRDTAMQQFTDQHELALPVF